MKAVADMNACHSGPQHDRSARRAAAIDRVAVSAAAIEMASFYPVGYIESNWKRWHARTLRHCNSLAQPEDQSATDHRRDLGGHYAL